MTSFSITENPGGTKGKIWPVMSVILTPEIIIH